VKATQRGKIGITKQIEVSKGMAVSRTSGPSRWHKNKPDGRFFKTLDQGNIDAEHTLTIEELNNKN